MEEATDVCEECLSVLIIPLTSPRSPAASAPRREMAAGSPAASDSAASPLDTLRHGPAANHGVESGVPAFRLTPELFHLLSCPLRELLAHPCNPGDRLIASGVQQPPRCPQWNILSWEHMQSSDVNWEGTDISHHMFARADMLSRPGVFRAIYISTVMTGQSHSFFNSFTTGRPDVAWFRGRNVTASHRNK